MNRTRRAAQLVLGCSTLGAGVALLVHADLGTDGFSTLISGLHRTTGVDFGVMNLILAVALVLLAWAKGQKPGPGTVAQVAFVSLVSGLLLRVLPELPGLGAQLVMFLAGFLVISLGIAAYLATDLGAGPAEGAALAFDPPVPFRWSYPIFQVVCIAVGWAFGATFGVGTVFLSLAIGPFVDRLMPMLGGTKRPVPPSPAPDGL